MKLLNKEINNIIFIVEYNKNGCNFNVKYIYEKLKSLVTELNSPLIIKKIGELNYIVYIYYSVTG